MTVEIALEEMKFYAYHGVALQERLVGNTFVVNLLLTASSEVERAVTNDTLEDTINYATAYEVVKREMAIPSKLIEHAAGRIMIALKATFPQIRAIEIKLSKLNPPFGGDIHCASVILRENYG